MASAEAPQETDTSLEFVLDEPATGARALAEKDAVCIAKRQKQIDYGKNTLGYVNYVKAVPREKRRCHNHGLTPVDPITPDVRLVCSKRAFDGQIRKWRRMLHSYDLSAAGTCDPLQEPAAANPSPPEGEPCAGPGDKRRCCAAAAAAKAPNKDASDSGKRARLAMAEEPAGRSIYDDWDEDDIAV